MIKLIGDVHGHFDVYQRLIEDTEYSIQLGDMGFLQMYMSLDSYVDPTRHQFVGGNHDDYDNYYQVPNSLGDFGQATLNNVDFFFVRGAESIDKEWRIADHRTSGRKTWWEEEQMSYRRLAVAIGLYKLAKPAIVLSHTCPQFVKGHILAVKYNGKDNITPTECALESMWEFHKPKVWVFGHFHYHFDKVIEGTRFICLDEFQTARLYKDGNVSTKS